MPRLYWFWSPDCPLCPPLEPRVAAFAARHQLQLIRVPTTSLDEDGLDVPSLLHEDRGIVTAGAFCVEAMDHLLTTQPAAD